MLLSLPDESLIIVLRFLHYKDLSNVSCVNQRFHRLCKDDSLWSWQCEHYFLNLQCEKGSTWYEHFISLYKEYGRYKNYKEIRQAWNKIEAFLEKNCPSILATLQDGVSEEELRAVEEHIQHPLPEDLRLSYRIHNGQDVSARSPGYLFLVYSMFHVSLGEISRSQRGLQGMYCVVYSMFHVSLSEISRHVSCQSQRGLQGMYFLFITCFMSESQRGLQGMYFLFITCFMSVSARSPG
ncbi:F-box only protein 3-like, partial [Ruditapes philippinarum]|uniref:F-box only protein 3-like n=1 Tax=Ruditapes philippinarum TaxID=129788 RepID=UPI00295BF6BF